MHNTVKDNVYYNNYGISIHFGDKIKLHFAGCPSDMIEPFTLVSAKEFFTTVNYKHEIELLIRSFNGIERTFSFARYYNPEPYEES